MGFLAQLLDFKLFLLSALIFVPFEWLFAARRQGTFRNLWQQDLIYVFVNGIVIRLGLFALFTSAFAAGPLLVPQDWHQRIAAQPLWLQVIAVLLIADLIFYLLHRLFHAVPALWRLHAIHHSIEEMDWLAAHRIHPIDQIVTKGASLVPCFALGFSDAAIAIYAIIYHWHTLLLHANVRLGWGPLGWLFTSPNFHHWHHCRDEEAWDRNFGTQIALWDFLVGTAHLPKRRTAERFGIGEVVPAGYGAQLLHPFRSRGSEAAPGNG